MPITALYASLLAPILVYLSIRVISVRRRERVEIGDGGHRELLRRTRVHANFIEYVPIALVLMGLLESVGARALLLHAIGLALLVGRLLHAYALSQEPHIMNLRVAGMALTFSALLLGALAGMQLALPRALGLL
jgi:hypothetical protein